MPLFARRPDGVLLEDLPGFQKILPYLWPTRTESMIVRQQPMRMKKTLALLQRLNEGRTERRYTPFHVALAAGVRLMAERPENNRFVIGRRIYQRKEIVFSFITKKDLTEDARETTVKVVFDPDDTLEKVAERVWEKVRRTKSSSSSRDEDLAETLTRLPRWLTRLAVWGWSFLDYFNILPASWIEEDPFYSSAFLANLGSIGLDAVQHHLYDWGTCSFFAVYGRVKKDVVVDERGELAVEDVMTTSFSFDERITDGVKLAKTIAALTRYMEDPEQLLAPPREGPKALVAA